MKPMPNQILSLLLPATLLLRASGLYCSQQAKVIGIDTKPGNYFGESVSISGDTVVAVAPNEDYVAEDAGTAYVFTRKGVQWSQQAKLVANDTIKKDFFGRSVCISGDTFVVSTRNTEGAAYVFSRAITSWGPVWTEKAKLQASDKKSGNEFGRSVAISGDVIIVGAPYDNDRGNYAGAAYIFSRFLKSNAWAQETKLLAKDTRTGHYFGDVVAISGATVVVGTSATTVGAVYVFTRSGSGWAEQAKLYRNVGNFGASLSIYHNTLLVGAPGADGGGNDAGEAYVFTRSGATWSQQAKLVAADRAEGHRFGISVSISGYLLTVASQGPAMTDRAGKPTYAGRAYVFAQDAGGSNWTQQMKVGLAVAAERYGSSIGLSGGYVVAGAPRETTGGTDAGAAYVLKCFTTTTTTTTTRTWTTRDNRDGLSPSNTKAVTSFALGRPCASRLMALLSMFAACHWM